MKIDDIDKDPIVDFTADNAEIESLDIDMQRFSDTAAALESLYQSSLPIYTNCTSRDVQLLTAAACEITNAGNFSLGKSFSLESSDSSENSGIIIIRKIKEYALKIWNVLIDAYQRVVEWIFDFFQRVTNKANSLKSKASALLKKINDGSYNTSDSSIIFKDSFVAHIGVTEGTPVAAFNNLYVFVKDIRAATTPRNFNNLFAAMEKLQKGDPGDEEMADLVEDIRKAYNPIFPYETDAGIDNAVDVEAGVSEPLPGNLYAYMTIPKTTAGLAYSKMTISSEEYGPYKSETGIGRLSKQDCISVIKNITDICDVYVDLSKIQNEIKEINNKLRRTKDVIQKSIDRDDRRSMDKEQMEIERYKSAFRAGSLRGLLVFIPRITAGIHQKTMSTSLDICSYGLTWVNKSIM